MARSIAISSRSSGARRGRAGGGSGSVSMSSQASGGSQPVVQRARGRRRWRCAGRRVCCGGVVSQSCSYSSLTSWAVRAVTVRAVMLRRRLAGERRSSRASQACAHPMAMRACRRRRVPVASIWLFGARLLWSTGTARMRSAVSRRTRWYGRLAGAARVDQGADVAGGQPGELGDLVDADPGGAQRLDVLAGAGGVEVGLPTTVRCVRGASRCWRQCSRWCMRGSGTGRGRRRCGCRADAAREGVGSCVSARIQRARRGPARGRGGAAALRRSAGCGDCSAIAWLA